MLVHKVFCSVLDSDNVLLNLLGSTLGSQDLGGFKGFQKNWLNHKLESR